MNTKDPAVYEFDCKYSANRFMRNIPDCEYSFCILTRDQRYYVATIEQATGLIEEDDYQFAT